MYGGGGRGVKTTATKIKAKARRGGYKTMGRRNGVEAEKLRKKKKKRKTITTKKKKKKKQRWSRR